MNDTIGVIGQKYVDRKSNKVGTLLDRDAENKKLSFLDGNGEPFQISYAAFKSNWRKVIVEAPKEAETLDEFVEEPTESSYSDVTEAEPGTEPSVTVKVLEPAKLDTEDQKIKNFVDTLTGCRVAAVDIICDETTIMADDVTICTLHKVENGYKMFMLPDIFIFAEWGDKYFSASDVHFNIKSGRYSGVLIDCVKASLGDILQAIKTAAVEINLYGYID